MKKIIALVAIAAACSTSAFAQVSNFTGPSAGVNMNMTSLGFDQSKIDGSGAEFGGKNNIGASLQAAYGFEVAPSTVLTVGATYSLTNPSFGELKAKTADIAAGQDSNITLKLKNSTSIYLEPGYLVSEKTLAYGLVSYERAKADVACSPVTKNCGDTSKTISGTGFGFGVRTMLDKQLSLQVQIKQVNYGSTSFDGDTKASFKAKSTVGSIGLGYKF